MGATTVTPWLKAKDFKSGVKPIWCPGCGPFAVLSAVTKALAHLKLRPECRRARDTFWDVQVPKMTALGDSLCARVRPAVAAVPDSPLVRRARQRPQWLDGVSGCPLQVPSAASRLRVPARALRLPGTTRPRFALPGAQR